METPKEGMIMESPSKDSISIYRNSEWIIYHSASSIKDLASDQITTLQSSKEELENGLEGLIFTASKLWDEVKPIKDTDVMKVTHPVIEKAKELLNK